MLSWGLEVNDYGNAVLDAEGGFIKVVGAGVEEGLWQEMRTYAAANDLRGGNYKHLNLVFENRIMGQPRVIRERMARRVEDFVYFLLTAVFNAGDTAELGVEAILAAGSYELGPKASRIESPEDWTEAKIHGRAAALQTDKGPDGDFDD
jgi:fructose-bisphosphate aldolase, class II